MRCGSYSEIALTSASQGTSYYSLSSGNVLRLLTLGRYHYLPANLLCCLFPHIMFYDKYLVSKSLYGSHVLNNAAKGMKLSLKAPASQCMFISVAHGMDFRGLALF